MILSGFPSVFLYLLIAIGAYIVMRSPSWHVRFLATMACYSGGLLVLPVILATLTVYRGTGYDPAQLR